MPIYPFICPVCGEDKEVFYHISEYNGKQECDNCGGDMKRKITVPAIHGTRDSFGIGKSFVDPESGKEITTWKEWEKAGYKPASESLKGGKHGRGDKAHTLFKEKLAKKTKDKIQV